MKFVLLRLNISSPAIFVAAGAVGLFPYLWVSEEANSVPSHLASVVHSVDAQNNVPNPTVDFDQLEKTGNPLQFLLLVCWKVHRSLLQQLIGLPSCVETVHSFVESLQRTAEPMDDPHVLIVWLIHSKKELSRHIELPVEHHQGRFSEQCSRIDRPMLSTEILVRAATSDNDTHRLDCRVRLTQKDCVLLTVDDSPFPFFACPRTSVFRVDVFGPVGSRSAPYGLCLITKVGRTVRLWFRSPEFLTAAKEWFAAPRRESEGDEASQSAQRLNSGDHIPPFIASRDVGQWLVLLRSVLPTTAYYQFEVLHSFGRALSAFTGASYTRSWWQLSLEKEFERQGLPPQWRITKQNCQFQLCETYPPILVVPAACTDDAVKDAATRRVKKRLQVLTYFHRRTRSGILRSSQPLGASALLVSEYDQALRHCSSTRQLEVFDLRSPYAVAANWMVGGASEIPSAGTTTVRNASIENIHVVRRCFEELLSYVTAEKLGKSAPQSQLTSTIQGVSLHWLELVDSILTTSIEVASLVERGVPSMVSAPVFPAESSPSKQRVDVTSPTHDGSPTTFVSNQGTLVLIHCSDGWDRTAQICCLAQLLLDPYFRTLEGFITLIEKDFVAFGHKFKTRMETGSKEFSPVFLLFLDGVRHVVERFPEEFEFTPRCLQLFSELSVSGLIGSFAFDSFREILAESAAEKTFSVGQIVHVCLKPTSSELGDKFCWTDRQDTTLNCGLINALYSPTSRVLLQPFPKSCLSLWSALFCKDQALSAFLQRVTKTQPDPMTLNNSNTPPTVERAFPGTRQLQSTRPTPRLVQPESVCDDLVDWEDCN